MNQVKAALGALVMLSGCDLDRPESVESALLRHHPELSATVGGEVIEGLALG
jgi:hypothetical protein